MAFDTKQERLVMAVTGNGEPRLLIWDTRQPEAEPIEHRISGACKALAIHPQAPQVALALDDRVSLFDLATKTEKPLIQVSDPVLALRFSADGKGLAVSDSSFTVCDVQNGEKRYVLPGPEGSHHSDFACEKILDFDDEGRVWAIGFVPGAKAKNRSVVRFAADGKSRTVVADEGLRGWVLQPLTAVLSPDRRRLAIAGQPEEPGGAESIFVLDLSAARGEHLSGHAEHIGAMAFSPDASKLATVSEGGSALRIWPLGKGK